ncbi:MAG: glycosyltransferase [Puniceicoccaceae bacterium]
MTFYRHFVEATEFEILVATNFPEMENFQMGYQLEQFKDPEWLQRVHRTRLLPWVGGFEYLWRNGMICGDLVQAASNFQAQIIFTVAGSWSWTALVAQKLSQSLRVPLVASFNDWYDFGWFPPHKFFHKAIERRFRRFYRECDLALCTSEGMREALGEHPNAHIWYPTGAPMPEAPDNYEPRMPEKERPFRVFFGGSLGEWYGKMVEDVVVKCREHHPQVEFRIFGSMASWSSDFDNWAKDNGVYGGQVSFDRLSEEAGKADLLLLPMGFDPSVEIVERTSFKTKFLDYLSFRRPILVWGPEYCSAVRVAREFDSAECVTNPDPTACSLAIKGLAEQPDRRKRLIANAMGMYNDRFHPDKIHAGLVRKISELVETWPVKQNG